MSLPSARAAGRWRAAQPSAFTAPLVAAYTASAALRPQQLAEVAAAAILVDIGLDIGRDRAERQAAALGVFALGMRNGVATTEALGKLFGDRGFTAAADPPDNNKHQLVFQSS